MVLSALSNTNPRSVVTWHKLEKVRYIIELQSQPTRSYVLWGIRGPRAQTMTVPYITHLSISTADSTDVL